MSQNIVSAKRKQQAAKHADRVHTCPCGKVCRGNGGWSSHKRSCETWREALDEQLGELPPRQQCPHGERIGACNACDIAGDFAYDAWRESR